MKSIKRRFDMMTGKNQRWSSYICFAEAIKQQKLNKESIQIWFNKLVSKDDYDKKDKKTLLDQLCILSNPKT